MCKTCNTLIENFDDFSPKSQTPCFFEIPKPIPLTFPTLSEEQEIAADLILQKQPVSVIAKAGSGKTTASIEIARRFYETYRERTLIITYNSRLKEETRSRIDRMGLRHAMEGHSFHAVATRFFDVGGYSYDESIERASYSKPKHPLNFGLIIVDETQDVNNLFYSFLKHILNECFLLRGQRPTLLLLGDPFQRIFGFCNSSSGYLTDPDTYFGEFVSHPFHMVHFSICWRITPEMAEFINTHLDPRLLKYVDPTWWEKHGAQICEWWGRGIRANPARPCSPESVKYVLQNNKNSSKRIEILVDTTDAPDFAILGYTLKQNSPLARIVDRFGVKTNKNWIVLDNNSEHIPSKDLFVGKYTASTIHKFKGLERKVVVVMGMNSFIENLPTYKENPVEHFNIFYVACTRASENLLIVVDKTRNVEEYATIRKHRCFTEYPHLRIEVLQLLDYVPYDKILSRSALFRNTIICEDEKKCVGMPPHYYKIKGRGPGTLENIKKFIGSAIHTRVSIVLGKGIYSIFGEKWMDDDMKDWLLDLYQYPPENWTWRQLILYDIVREVVSTKYKHYWRQCKKSLESLPDGLEKFMDWSLDNAIHMLYRMAVDKGFINSRDGVSEDEMIESLKPLIETECPVSYYFPLLWWKTMYDDTINGRIDIILGGRFIIELKVSETSCKFDQNHNSQVNIYKSIKCIEAVQRAKNSDSPQQREGVEQNFVACVLVANKALIYETELRLSPCFSHISADEEYLYRILRRKASMCFDEASMIKELYQSKQSEQSEQ